MSFSLRHLKRLEQGMRISVPTDEHGLTGRECPNPDCLGYFKVKFGTGLKGENLPCYCPYCGFKADHDQFWTQEQIDYAQSIAMNEVTKALKADIKDWDRNLRQSTRNSFVKLSVEFKGGLHPIRYYQEKQLETNVVCETCTLEYAVYGAFAFCPDCGTHNSLQIMAKNLELAEKEIALAKTTEDAELSVKLIEDALENAVSTFDAFGRATCAAYSSKAANPDQAKEISFQNITAARTRVQAIFGVDFADSIDSDQWAFIVRGFQKRHLLAHTMGVIDDEYIKKSNDKTAIVGRKVTITSEEVVQLLGLLKVIGNRLFETLKK
jgi:hypothetical protein